MFSNRVGNINPFIVMEILEKSLEMEEKGIDIKHFEIGEPDFDTPEPIVKGCLSELQQSKTHYTHSLGYLELRESISKYKQKTRNTKYNPKSQIMVTSGTSPAFFILLSTLLNPGDEVIITDPGYPCYTNFINFFGGKPIIIPIYEEDNFDLRLDLLKKLITKKTKLIILNSPSNPTGQIIPADTLNEMSDLITKNNIYVISDEIYSELTYDKKIAPSLSDKIYSRCHDKLIILDGFSKYWAMTGWRLGFILAPPQIIKAMVPVQQNFLICAPSISQAAGIYAYDCEKETKNMLQLYKNRRDYIVKRINNINGISCLNPKGAFYVFVNIKKIQMDSIDFSNRLLKEAHIATCPGISFGSNGEGYIRFSYPTDINNIKIGMNRLEEFIKKID
ncbi:MAG: pyridoxal phosphate-dependent aminotransferase [archaeon]|nr:pyridoxal phosphate-dependent aminotransferase [archaeon]